MYMFNKLSAEFKKVSNSEIINLIQVMINIPPKGVVPKYFYENGTIYKWEIQEYGIVKCELFKCKNMEAEAELAKIALGFYEFNSKAEYIFGSRFDIEEYVQSVIDNDDGNSPEIIHKYKDFLESSYRYRRSHVLI